MKTIKILLSAMIIALSGMAVSGTASADEYLRGGGYCGDGWHHRVCWRHCDFRGCWRHCEFRRCGWHHYYYDDR